jgi:hypothetical protein
MEFISLRLGSILEPARASQQPRCITALNDPNARERKGPPRRGASGFSDDSLHRGRAGDTNNCRKSAILRSAAIASTTPHQAERRAVADLDLVKESQPFHPL